MTEKQIVASTTHRTYYIICYKHSESPRTDKIDTIDSKHCMNCCDECYHYPIRYYPCEKGMNDLYSYIYHLRKKLGITKPNKLLKNKEDKN